MSFTRSTLYFPFIRTTVYRDSLVYPWESRQPLLCFLSFFLSVSQEYLSAALKHLDDRERRGSGHGAKDVKGIWVASDSQDAVGEVRALAREYFPNVSDEAIVWISGGNSEGPVTTHSKHEVGRKYGERARSARH